MIWCTLLNPALDVLYRINDFHIGGTYTNRSHLQVPAGKGLNVARGVAALGEEVTVIGILPEADSKRVTSFLNDHAISGKFVYVPGTMRINTTILDETNRSTTHCNALSAAQSPRVQHEFAVLTASQMSSGDYWVFSGSLPPGFTDDAYASLIAAGGASGVHTALDSRGEGLRHGLRSRPNMVKPNLAELEEFFEEPIRGVHHIALKGKRLLDMGITYVFISLGADGMIALHKNDCLLCSTPQVTVKDTVGCGDAMLAGIVVAHKRLFSFSETCRLAIACGSAKSIEHGPGSFSRETVWQLMEDVEISSI